MFLFLFLIKTPGDIIALHLCTKNLNYMIYRSILGHFLHFYPPKHQKSKFWKKEKNCWRYHHFTHVYQKLQSLDVWIRSETDRFFCHSTDINFCHSGSCFATFTPLKSYKIETLKTWKNTWRYYWFTQVYHKWQSYHVWFQRYGTWRTFCHFGFFPFTSLTTQKIKLL